MDDDQVDSLNPEETGEEEELDEDGMPKKLPVDDLDDDDNDDEDEDGEM